MHGRERETEQHQPGRRQPEADPLPAADSHAEDALGHDREQHHPAGQHRLNDRQRHDRHRGDVEDPGAAGDHHPDGEPAGGVQLARGAERPAHVDRGRRAGATVLVEEADVGRERAGEREQDA